MSKKYEIKNGDISDGYHTFDELYEHRCLLFIAWIISVDSHIMDVIPSYIPDHFEGWDLIWTSIPDGTGDLKQISYHVPVKYRHLYRGHCNRQEVNSAYDGHTSGDVIKRITEFLESQK